MKILCLPRETFFYLIRQHKITPCSLSKMDNICIITVHDITDRDIHFCFRKESSNILMLKFDDVVEDTVINDKWAKCITVEQSNKIIDFLDINKNYDYCFILDNDKMSRNGAIGIFATEYLNLDMDEFKRNNTHINPNKKVLEILRNN